MGRHLRRGRITGAGDCVEQWQAHIATLERRVKKLNQLNFKSLHYTNSLGTDLTVELPEGHIWEAGNDVTLAAGPISPTSPRRRCLPPP